MINWNNSRVVLEYVLEIDQILLLFGHNEYVYPERYYIMIFIDSSNVEEISDLNKWGVVSGVTTNPLILLKDNPNVDLEKTIKEICSTVSGLPVSVELTQTSYSEMIREALVYAGWSKNINIKVPVTPHGLKVINHLSKQGIWCNATCIMSTAQAYLAALAGARYVSVFVGRIADMGYDPYQILKDCVQTCNASVLAASLRSVEDVRQSIMTGCPIQTIQPKILRQMIQNPRTESTINEFNSAWENRPR